MKDWVALHRSLFSHPMFRRGRFDKRAAWIWIFCQAAYCDHRADTGRGGLIQFKRGEVLCGLDHLSKTFSWSVSEVRTFLAKLVSEGMLEKSQSRNQYAAVYLVVNYETYQGGRASHLDETASEPQANDKRGASQSQHIRRETKEIRNSAHEGCAPDRSLMDEFGFEISEDALREFHETLVCWGLKRCQLALQTSGLSRDIADRQLAGEIRSVRVLNPGAAEHLVAGSVYAAINTLTAQQKAEQDSGACRASGSKAGLGYFREVLRKSVKKAMLEEANLQAQAGADQHMHKLSLAKREERLEQGIAQPSFGAARPGRSSFATAEFPS